MALETLFTAAAIGSAVGTGVSAIGQYQSARASQATAQQNARIAQQNAALQEDQQRRSAKRELATARAQVAGQGVLTNGSSLSVLSDMAGQFEERALLIRYGGEVESARASQRAAAFGSAATASAVRGVAGVGTGLLGSAYTYRNEFGGSSNDAAFRNIPYFGAAF